MRSNLKKWFYGLLIMLCYHNIKIECKNKIPQTQESLVEVRAVFINCETDGRQDNPDSPSQRFERQELFKHDALRDCSKKLALTVKIASADPADVEHAKENTDGDEYIPIDHVFEGSDHKRVRLLNPYILRLRRELPKQAYKLNRIDTVSGILTNARLLIHSDDSTAKRQAKKRLRRDLDQAEHQGQTGLILGSAAFPLKNDKLGEQSYSDKIGRLQELIKTSATKPQEEKEFSQDCDNRDVYIKTNCSSREKRQGHGMMIVTPKYSKDHHYQKKSTSEEKYNYENEGRAHKNALNIDESVGINEDDEEIFNTARSTRSYSLQKLFKHKPKDKSRQNELHTHARSTLKYKDDDDSGKIAENVLSDKSGPEKAFAVYEIGKPNLWYDVKVHLFEKLSTAEGKTVWNDLTKGKDASVSSTNPEWKSQDVNVRYRPAEWVPRDDFTLPATRLCLLEHLRDNDTTFEDDPNEFYFSNQKYIVVPIEDVVYLENKMNVKKRDETGMASNDSNDYEQIQGPRRVEVRVSRAIMGSKADNFDIAHLGTESFLMIPHRRPHRSQIDVEVRADENVLVRVGSSGRLATVVTDNTRKKRTTVHFQATNTGLASARFKAVIRECGPELSTLIKQKGSEEISSESVVLPPHHMRRLKLEVPVEIPVDVTHCNVVLVNDEDEPLAVRDVSIKKGDRCFCVWHCECVCLSDDPKLLCREMSQAQQLAAGLSPSSEQSRHVRSVCYKDNVALDFFGVLFGVLVFLLFLGLIKAFVGLFNLRVGQQGWECLLGPTMLDCYHEPCLRHRRVVYKDGWPVHPDTCERTVRILSCPASFLVNLVFFIAVPCIALYKIIKAAIQALKQLYWACKCRSQKVEEQIFSAHDVQSSSMELVVRKKRKRRTLTDWMTPGAEKLTADILKGAMDPTSSCCCVQNNEMQPLLTDNNKPRSSVGAVSAPPDSEQEDTEYVLMQMQKSRESLARSHNKFDDSLQSAERNLTNTRKK